MVSIAGWAILMVGCGFDDRGGDSVGRVGGSVGGGRQFCLQHGALSLDITWKNTAFMFISIQGGGAERHVEV